jgi:hypothetical protein
MRAPTAAAGMAPSPRQGLMEAGRHRAVTHTGAGWVAPRAASPCSSHSSPPPAPLQFLSPRGGRRHQQRASVDAGHYLPVKYLLIFNHICAWSSSATFTNTLV